MLGTFMAGLALGGYLGGKFADRNRNLLFLFGLLEFGIGTAGLLAMPIIGLLPPFYFRIYKAFHLSPSLFFIFQFALCSAVMLVPTTLMGATFPVVSWQVTRSMEDMGSSVGNAYSFNTFGAIAGAFSTGFLLIPFWGVKAAIFIAAGLNILTGVALIAGSGVRLRTGAAALVLLLFLSLAAAYSSPVESWPVSYYMASRVDRYDDVARENASSTVLFEKDFREGRVKLWRDRQGLLILQTGGKIEGTGEKDLANTRLLAYLPVASHPAPKSFLTIGLGTGVTLASAKEHVRDVSLVEINKGVIEAIRSHGPSGLFDGVDVTVQDARNYLFLNEKRFDIISSEPSYPTEASTANLFTREFYELAATRLNEGGAFCQWLPYYALSNRDATMMLKTFGSVFPHVYLWKAPQGFDLLMLGSKEPFKFNAREIQARVASLNRSGGPLDFVLSRDPGQVREIIQTEGNVLLNTDDKPVLEFHAARNFITGVMD
jgi:spermidine synthase